MPPHPTVDTERKEELILAKQIRGCTVSILPRGADNCYQLKSPSPTPLRSPQQSPEPQKVCEDGRDLEGEAHKFIAELTAMTLKQRRNNGKECSSDLPANRVSPLSPNSGALQRAVVTESGPNFGRNNKELRESDLILINSPKIMVTPPPQEKQAEELQRKNLSRFFANDEEDSTATRSAPLPPKLPFLNEIKMLKKADPVPIAAPSLDPREVNEDDQRWTVEDQHLGHIEKRPQLGKLPFLGQIKSMRPPSPPSPMPSTKNPDYVSLEKVKVNPSTTVSSPGLALVQAMKEICEVTEPKPLNALQTTTIPKSNLSPSNPQTASAQTQCSKWLPAPSVPLAGSQGSGEGQVSKKVFAPAVPQVAHQKGQAPPVLKVPLQKSQPAPPPPPPSHQKGQAPPPPPPPPQGWNQKPSLPTQIQAPATFSQQNNSYEPKPAGLPKTAHQEQHSRISSTTVDLPEQSMSHTIIERARVESTSVSPSKPVSEESQNRRTAVIEDSSKHSSSPKPSRAKKCPKNVIKLDEKSNMGKLADQILPQLNHMQKNFLGLLFFNELSSNIVDDMVAQQLSMMSANKLASVMGNVDQEACDAVLPILVEGVNADQRTSLACQLMAGLDTEEKAGVVFTTSENVMEVCSGVAEYGGRAFKKALIRNLMATEDSDFMEEIIFNHLKRTNRTQAPELRTIPEHKRSTATTSSADDDFTSCEASLAEDVDKEEEDDYEYLDFQ